MSPADRFRALRRPALLLRAAALAADEWQGPRPTLRVALDREAALIERHRDHRQASPTWAATVEALAAVIVAARADGLVS